MSAEENLALNVFAYCFLRSMISCRSQLEVAYPRRYYNCRFLPHGAQGNTAPSCPEWYSMLQNNFGQSNCLDNAMLQLGSTWPSQPL